jgi:TRAP-type uncharacterized transport system substrate-binding protein
LDSLLFTNAKASDDAVYRVIDAMAKNKDDLVTVQPALRRPSLHPIRRAVTLR